MTALPVNVGDTLALLSSGNYIADRSLATAVHLALALKRPLFLEGEAGVGKTEIAKVLAETLGRQLIRPQPAVVRVLTLVDEKQVIVVRPGSP